MSADEHGLVGTQVGQQLFERRDGSYLHIGPALAAGSLHILTAAIPRPEVGEALGDFGGHKICPFAVSDLPKADIVFDIEAEELSDGSYGAGRPLKI
jgi:hypothetical protein